jgi:transcriptional regulator with XRE-family HTH domain
MRIEANSVFFSPSFAGSLKWSMDNLTLFGKRLSSIRGRRSRASIAEAAKISSGYLGELERGEKWPALDIIVELATALAVSPGAFFEFESEEVDSQILHDKLAGALENKDTRQLQQALRIIKALDIG